MDRQYPHLYEMDEQGYYVFNKFSNPEVKKLATEQWWIYEEDDIFLFTGTLISLYANLRWGILSKKYPGRACVNLVIRLDRWAFTIDTCKVKPYCREAHRMEYWL